MPFQPLKFQPGIIRDLTRKSGSGGWYDCDKVRFRNGLPEKIGGWEKRTTDAHLGICRSLFSWSALDGSEYMGVGTNTRFYIEEAGSLYNITPFRTNDETLAANPISTNAAGSGLLTVSDTAHGAVAGDMVNITGAATFDGIAASVLNSDHQITSVIDSNSYRITVDDTATSGSTAGGGSAVVVRYEVNTAPVVATGGVGYGASWYGGFNPTAPSSTLSSGINSSVTSLTLADATSFITASTTLSTTISTSYEGGIEVASVASFPDAGSIKIDSEIISYNSRNTETNTLGDVKRARDGTTAAAHSSSATITFVGLVSVGAELITYTGKSSNTLSGLTRGLRGTDAASHSSGAVVTVANTFVEYGGSASGVGAATGTGTRIWSQDNFGEDLVYNIKDGAIFYWDKSLGKGAHGVDINDLTGASNCPVVARQLIVSDVDRHLIVFGANNIGETEQDKMLIRWADTETITEWTPTSTNSSGDIRLNNGSEIVGAHQTRQEILVWTDTSLHSLRYVGAPFIFGTSILSTGTTIQSGEAMASIGDLTFWMSARGFYVYDGRVQRLNCPITDYIFDDINTNLSNIIFAGVNAEYDEITWWYPSKDATEIDRYVIYNVVEQAWYFGRQARTAWNDRANREYPTAANPNDKLLYEHDKGLDDGETSPASGITAYVESADIIMGEGESFQFAKKLFPDVSFTSSEADSPAATFTLKARNGPGLDYDASDAGSVVSTRTVDVERFTDQSNIRLRGRFMAFRVESTGAGTHWRLGVPIVELRSDGRR